MNLARIGRPGIGVIRAASAALAMAVVLVAAAPATAAVNSATYKFAGNTWLSLDLATGDVRTELIRFDWPAAILGVKSGYKAVVKVVNGSAKQAGVGLAVAVFDADGKLLGAGTTGTKIGTVDPGDSAEFTIEFDHVFERLEQASQFRIALQTQTR
jgi:hypothetical protein